MATLIQNQASFVADMAETNRGIAETDRRIAEYQRLSAERLARLEAIMLEYARILKRLPEAVLERIGFKGPPRPAE